MLYSYLLTRSEFKIETAPETSSHDRRYAYDAYVTLLMYMLRLSGCAFTPAQAKGATSLARGTKLADTKTARSLMQNEDVRAMALRNDIDEDVLAHLHAVITASSAYRDFSKIKSPEIREEVAFWRAVVGTVFAKDTTLAASMRGNADFTVKGFEKGVQMLSDTLANYSDTKSLVADARRDLLSSLDKAYDLYHALLWLPVEITRYQQARLEAAKEKFLATDEDMNPNMRFVDNGFVAALQANPEMETYAKEHDIAWSDDDVMLRVLLDKIMATPQYKEYMETPEGDFASDCEFWRQMMKNVILPSDELVEALENKSIYWNDDLAIMGTFVLKTIKQFGRDGEHTHLLEKYKDEEDAKFGLQLFEYTVKNREEYRAMIDRFINSQKWDTERLALMDIVILETALAEILNFPAIPIAVSVNEYVEIANWYSAPRSGSFINGLLAAVTSELI
ncbi:MAG: transcription antitermination protein NusB, partial [Muribaculaceae bacterium]|nr:transcription antitermination protein NusB [Muribaculaceae bacterium]